MSTIDIHDHVKHVSPEFEGTVQGVFRTRAGRVYCTVQTYNDRMFIVAFDKLILVRKSHDGCKHELGFSFLSSATDSKVFFCRLGCGLSKNNNDGITILDKPGSRHTKELPKTAEGGKY